MPELPEVETIRIGLNQLLPGQTIDSVDFNWDKSFPNSPANVSNFLLGAKIIDVKRRAKVLLIELTTNYSLVIHLKMTGQLVFRSQNYSFGAGHPNDSLIGQLPDKSTRVTITMASSSMLFFNDQRKVGPEPLSSDLSWQILKSRLAKRKNSAIKPAILDQTVLAGIGNIYADESLWGAKIHPATLVKNLSDNNYEKLYQEIVYVLKLSIEKGGSTDKNYIDAEGKKGSYLSFARVFRREGQSCSRCGHTIEKIRLSGRGTHFCPVCQVQP
jgi:formamidopyrimidine-DNA glycosylase